MKLLEYSFNYCSWTTNHDCHARDFKIHMSACAIHATRFIRTIATLSIRELIFLIMKEANKNIHWPVCFAQCQLRAFRVVGAGLPFTLPWWRARVYLRGKARDGKKGETSLVESLSQLLSILWIEGNRKRQVAIIVVCPQRSARRGSKNNEAQKPYW